MTKMESRTHAVLLPSSTRAADVEHIDFKKKTVTASEHWYLALLKPGGFTRARQNLQRQGFASFMPMIDVTSQHAGRFNTRLVPLFPGYLFVRIRPESSGWRAINSTFGVSRLVVLFGGCPTEVPPSLISGLRARCDDLSRLIPSNEFEIGADVRVVSGPFTSALATIESVTEGNRAWILMDMMGQKIRTAVMTDALQQI